MEGNITNQTAELSLTEMEHKHFMKNINTIICLAIISVVGTFGCLHVIMVYSIHYKPSRHRAFLLFLDIVDIIPCALLITYRIIFAIVYRFSFQSNALCKIEVYLTQALGLSSIGILTLLSLERYYTICLAKTKYCSRFQIKMFCCIAIACASIISSPNLVYSGNDYSIQDLADMGKGYTTQDSKEKWKRCTILRPYRDTQTFKTFYKVTLGVSVVLFIICAITYALLGRFLRNHRRLPAFENELSTGTRLARNLTYDKSIRTILTYFVATLLSYIFYFSVHVLVLFLTVFDGATVVRTLGPFYGICLRLNFVGHAINPIVYGLMDKKFRQKCKLLYKCLYINLVRCFSIGGELTCAPRIENEYPVSTVDYFNNGFNV